MNDQQKPWLPDYNEAIPLDGDVLYSQAAEDILTQLETDSSNGLTAAEAEKRLEELGPNTITEEKKETLLQKLLNQFKDFMILILIAAAIISGLLGEMADSIIIIAIVVINAILGVYQEGKAEKAIESLQKMSAPHARILRDGQQMSVEASNLVPGDIVMLEAGDIVPADIRLIESSNLKAEEAALTGESVPVEKDAAQKLDVPQGIGDRVNMVFSSTSITYGRAKGVVVTTADHTEVGKIASRLKGITREMTPLQKNLNQLGKILGVIVLIVSAIVFVAGLLQGGEVLPLFMTAVSLAVAAIPEGLPAVVTIVLSLGMNRMAKKNAIVKRLLAVETLGSVDVICSDKTGTLTQNEMTVTRLYADNQSYKASGIGYAPVGEISKVKAVEGAEETRAAVESADAVVTDEVAVASDNPVLQRLLEIGVLCNDAELVENDQWGILGDPTEGAMLSVAAKGKISAPETRAQNPRRGELPFDSDRKLMTVYHDTIDEAYLSLTKGAPDIILDRCEAIMTSQGIEPLTSEIAEKIMDINIQLARQALRILAFAYKEHNDANYEGAEEGMVFVGLMGMIDPARAEAKAAIEVCHGAGIKVVMITGDYKETAVAIANDLGLREPNERVVDGAELEKMSQEELVEIVSDTTVYARVSPEHKVRIVEALRSANHISSMTGDGVNDAPALKEADIGVAMGITGTEVAKGSADMILTDDNFATIVHAVEEGRIIYSNIRKFVNFLLSCNVGEILVIFITNLLLGPAFTPLAPIQLLWLNLVTDSFPALALGRERGEDDVMEKPPRPNDAKILDRDMMWSILNQAAAIFVAVFAAFQIGRFIYPDVMINAQEQITAHASSFSFLPFAGYLPSWGARTYAFITLIMAELFRAYSSRSEDYSVFHLGLFSNATLNKAVLISFALTLSVVYLHFLQPLFYTISLTVPDWLRIMGLALFPFFAGELYKLVRRKYRNFTGDKGLKI